MTEENNKVKKYLGEDYECIDIIHENNYKYLKIKHLKCGEIFKVTTFHLSSHKGCPSCNHTIKQQLTTEIFKQRMVEMYNDEYSLLSEYKSIHKKVTIKHNICGTIWDITPNNFLNKKRKCPTCFKYETKTTEIFKKEVYDMYQDEYTVLDEYINCRTKILMQHNVCNTTWKIKPNDFLRGKKCPYCNKHKSESSHLKKIRQYLYENCIRFRTEEVFDTCKDKNNLRFDVYLIDFDLLIEFDGPQHDKPGWYGDKTGAFATLKKHDKMKDEWCKENNIPLLRLNYKQDYISVLDNYLNENFDIIEVDEEYINED